MIYLTFWGSIIHLFIVEDQFNQMFLAMFLMWTLSLQELKNLLLEAQKGPESLQEALRVQAGNHRSQQDQLRELIDSLRDTLAQAFTHSAPQGKAGPTAARPALSLPAFTDLQVHNKKTESLLGQLQQGVGKVQGELLTVRKLLETKAQTGPQTQSLAAGSKRHETQNQWGSETLVRGLEDTQRTLGEGIRMNTVYNAVFTYTAAAITISAVFLLLRGSG